LSDVLVIEDNDDLRDLFAESLRGAGYSVDAASGPGEAVACLRESAPSVVLLDLMMSSAGENDLLAELRESLRVAHIPVVLISGAVNLGVRAAELGAAEYLSKPIDADKLLDVVRRHAGRG
jgi:two-component system nitrogen regulation response regulator NtrX